MASQPFKRAFLAKLKTIGGFTPIFERTADGEPLARIAADYGCSRSWLHGLISRDPKRKALFQEARRLSAAAKVERAGELIEHAKENRDALMKVKLQVEHMRWEAEKYDRDTFGEAPMQVNVTSIGELHLAALRHREVVLPAPEQQALPAETA